MENKKFQEDLVSVIIPVYNSEKFLKETLNSALNQTYKNIEIIIINDCSVDNSENIIKSYCSKYKNIIYYKKSKNEGVAVARNLALDIAKGRYVAFLDSDDLWEKEKVEKQITLMKEKEASISYTAIEMIDEHQNKIKNKREVREIIDYNFLLHNTMIATSSVIVDRKKTENFKMPLRRSGQDYATWLMLLHNGNKAYGINEALVKYRIRNNSLSSNKLKSIKQVFEIQVKEEKINIIKAGYNTLLFCINALKKYYL